MLGREWNLDGCARRELELEESRSRGKKRRYVLARSINSLSNIHVGKMSIRYANMQDVL